MLGDFDGPAATARLLRALRGAEHPLPDQAATVPVVVLSGGAGQLALLRCFEAGADDYLAKPACYLELRARIRAVLARAGGSRAPAVRRVGRLVLDTATRRASYAVTELALSRLEWRLLAHLSEQPGRVYTKHELRREIWGCDAEEVRTRTVDAHAPAASATRSPPPTPTQRHERRCPPRRAVGCGQLRPMFAPRGGVWGGRAATHNPPIGGPHAAQERPTAKQQSYLRSLAKRTGTTFTPPKTKRDASAEIKRLKGLKRSAGHERAGDRDAVQAAPRGGAARVRDDEIEGHGSTATWGAGRATPEGS